jgi:hypothetical protein
VACGTPLLPGRCTAGDQRENNRRDSRGNGEALTSPTIAAARLRRDEIEPHRIRNRLRNGGRNLPVNSHSTRVAVMLRRRRGNDGSSGGIGSGLPYGSGSVLACCERIDSANEGTRSIH